MTEVSKIEQVSGSEFESAATLLIRFFGEEQFHTPPEIIRQNLKSFIEDDSTAVFVIGDETEKIGVATISTGIGVELGRAAELEDLYILPEARGKGAARALMIAAQNWCKAQNCEILSIVITSEGEKKHGLSDFYGKIGFRETGRKIMFYDLS